VGFEIIKKVMLGFTYPTIVIVWTDDLTNHAICKWVISFMSHLIPSVINPCTFLVTRAKFIKSNSSHLTLDIDLF